MQENTARAMLTLASLVILESASEVISLTSLNLRYIETSAEKYNEHNGIYWAWDRREKIQVL